MFSSINKATKWLQESGVGYHYQTMWHDVLTAFQRKEKIVLQRLVERDAYLPQSYFIERDYKRPENYYYRGDVYFNDPATDELYRRSYSIYADTSLTDREVEELIYAQEEGKVEEYGKDWEVVGFESLERFHKWGASRSQGYGIAEI